MHAREQEVRRERAERADTGGNFQQMFDTLRAKIRELGQKDNKQERERETGMGSRERRADAEMGNPTSQAGRRSRNRGM